MRGFLHTATMPADPVLHYRALHSCNYHTTLACRPRAKQSCVFGLPGACGNQWVYHTKPTDFPLWVPPARIDAQLGASILVLHTLIRRVIQEQQVPRRRVTLAYQRRAQTKRNRE